MAVYGPAGIELAIMTRRRILGLAALTAAMLLAGAAPALATGAPAPGDPAHWRVRLIGERDLPKDLTVGGTKVGELSGIDYDPRTGSYVLIADDTTEGPARYYTARVGLSRTAVTGVDFTGVRRLLRPDGTEFPRAGDEGRQTVDPESIRVDPRDGTLWWSSEGERAVPTDGSAPYLVDPFVRRATRGGRYLGQMRLPANLRMSAKETGPRANLVLEGLTLSADGRQVAASTEGALYQDGPIATVDHGAVNRVTWWDRRTGRPVRQLAYPLDAIPAKPDPPSGPADNGISELLAAGPQSYLAVERSYITGVGNSIRVYAFDTRGATNVLRRGSLTGGGYRTVGKRLVVDLGKLGLAHVDNIEGVTWGPRLATGERTLVFVADDNFSPSQTGQVIAVAVR